MIVLFFEHMNMVHVCLYCIHLNSNYLCWGWWYWIENGDDSHDDQFWVQLVISAAHGCLFHQCLAITITTGAHWLSNTMKKMIIGWWWLWFLTPFLMMTAQNQMMAKNHVATSNGSKEWFWAFHRKMIIKNILIFWDIGGCTRHNLQDPDCLDHHCHPKCKIVALEFVVADQYHNNTYQRRSSRISITDWQVSVHHLVIALSHWQSQLESSVYVCSSWFISLQASHHYLDNIFMFRPLLFFVCEFFTLGLGES